MQPLFIDTNIVKNYVSCAKDLCCQLNEKKHPDLIGYFKGFVQQYDKPIENSCDAVIQNMLINVKIDFIRTLAAALTIDETFQLQQRIIPKGWKNLLCDVRVYACKLVGEDALRHNWALRLKARGEKHYSECVSETIKNR